MNISWNWLKEYIQLDEDVDSVAKILTDIGLEVEGLEKYQTIKGGLQLDSLNFQQLGCKDLFQSFHCRICF